MAFLDRYDADYAPQLAHRAAPFRAVFAGLFGRGPVTIIETGCLREDGNFAGDGQSTLLFAAFVSEIGGEVLSVDNCIEHVETARSVCAADCGSAPVTISFDDSVVFLSRLNQSIDLLYLDSVDFDGNEPLRSATHHLFELCAAMRNLRAGSIVMVDDTWRVNDRSFGKGMLIEQYMERIGAEIVVRGEYQVAWTL